MPDEDKNFGGSLVLDFRKWWRHVKTIYSSQTPATLSLATGSGSLVSCSAGSQHSERNLIL